MDRRNFIKYGATLSAGFALSSIGFASLKSMESLSAKQKKAIVDYNPLYIPPLLYYPSMSLS